MAPPAKKAYVSLTYAKKVEVLEALKTRKQVDVAKEFGVDKATISRIKKNEYELRYRKLANENLQRKRQRDSRTEDVAEVLIAWFHEMMAKNAIINGPMMLEKARQFAVTLGHQDWDPSHGWLERLKNKHNIKFHKVSRARVVANP